MPNAARQSFALAVHRREGPHEADIADDIGEISGHSGSTGGKAVVQMAAAGSQPGNASSEDWRDRPQRRGQMAIDDTHDRYAADHRSRRRDRIPSEAAFDAERRVPRCRYAGRQRARKAVREIAHPMTRQMIEKIAPQIAPDTQKQTKNPPRRPPGDATEDRSESPPAPPPQQIVTGDQREQQHDGGP